ncbi:MAG TPA: ParB/RepB/Spo0J family partition protein [Gemmatimonadaceae bacterium]|nr:ParB/RepB/Spo0J family partition protein [Gemmatimonadaceae bacterium]
MSTEKQQRRLGRGLEALISSAPTVPAPRTADVSLAGPPAPYREIPLASIRPNRYQPRREFGPSELAELQASMKASGLLQPVTVRPVGDRFELIAGERRLRAAAGLGWEKIPAVVKAIDDKTALTLALIENLQRADLNPLEEAEGYQRLIEEFELTQQQVAEVVGKDRSTVANILRILALPASVKRMVAESQLTLGHARALLAFTDERALADAAREIVAHGLTVRDVERMAREGSRKPSAKQGSGDTRPAEARRIEEQLRRHLQTDVQLSLTAKEKGEIRIPFYSADDLERMLDLILGARRDSP